MASNVDNNDVRLECLKIAAGMDRGPYSTADEVLTDAERFRKYIEGEEDGSEEKK